MTMATSILLSEFPVVSTEAWERAIHEDLKGADYDDKLIWHTAEGIDGKPYYRAEDLAGLTFLDAAPGEFPYVRGARCAGGSRIREEVDAVDPEEASTEARRAVDAGAEEIAFCAASVQNSSDLGILLANLAEIPVHFENVDDRIVYLLLERLVRRQNAATISAGLNWNTNADASADLIARAPAALVPFTIGVEELQDGGATAVEEVGYALASGVDFLAEMKDRGVAADCIGDSVTFSFAMGPDFYMQIAKLRAFRMVWAQAMETFGGTHEHAKARIYARTSRWNRTLYDAQVNMLRGTTEAIAAILGGADSLYVAPFDACYKAPDEFSRRLARNTQLILKHEAFLARVVDPGGGSYCLESLTDEIASRAWKLLQDVEASGGYRKASEAGVIARMLEERSAAREKAVTARRRVLTGTNRFADASERALDRIEGQHVRGHHCAAEPFEQLRLRTERHAIEARKNPRVLLAEIGDAKMRSARSNFAADFFACAGFDLHTERFEDARKIATSHVDLIVLCSSDVEYPAIATELLAELKSRGVTTPLIVAGNPETSEQLRTAGVSDFVHLRTNPIEFLTKLQRQLGIKD
jgi:methylmalonyl-CoA mutase